MIDIHPFTPTSSTTISSRPHEKSLLLQEEDPIEHTSARELQVIDWKGRIKIINNRLQVLRLPNEGLPVQTALIKFTSAQLISGEHHEDRQSETSRPFMILHSLEPIFDQEVTPRKIANCCSPSCRVVFKAGGALLMYGAVSVMNAGLKNGVFGHYVNPTNSTDSWYSPGGVTSDIVIALAFLLDGPIGAKLGYDLVGFLLEQPRSSLRSLTDEEIGEPLTQARFFQKTTGQRALEILLIPASAVFGLMPLAPYLQYEKPFFLLALGFTVPALVYFGAPYYKKGKIILEKLYADNFSITSHRTREIRLALDASLADLEELLRKDKRTKRHKNKLLNSIWTILDERTRHFGGGGRIEDLQEEEIVSALSALFTNVLATNEQPETEYEANWNNMLAQQVIKDKSFKHKLAEGAATGLMWLNVYPNVLMGKYTTSKVLETYGTSEAVGSSVGYGVSAPFSFELLIEREIYKERFMQLADFLTSSPDDNVAGRRTAKILHALPAALFTTTLFTILYTLSCENVSDPLFYMMMPAVILRFFFLFFSVAADESEDIITRAQIKTRERPSVEQKSAQVNNCLKTFRYLVRYKLSDHSALELSKVIFRGN